MGKRGPAKQPAELKDARGTRKKSRDPDPPKVEYGLPPNPFVDGTPEAETWDLLLAVMKAAQLDGILTRADEGTLEAASIAWCRARQASSAVSALPVGGRYVMTKANGLRPHPAIAEERATWGDFRRFASDLGLSPSARASVGTAATPGAGSSTDDMDALTQALLNAKPLPIHD